MMTSPHTTTFTPGSSSIPVTKVELSLSCAGLADMDTFSKSDPFAVLYLQDSQTGDWVYVDKTETVDNTLYPHWVKKFLLDYQFETRQMLKVCVYDSDGDSTDLSSHDLIGCCECSLGEVLVAQGRGVTRALEGVKKGQTLTLVGEEVQQSNQVLILNIEGKGLDRKDWCGLGYSDPFLSIHRSGEFDRWVVVHRTEVRKRNLNPVWDQIELSLSVLCQADLHRPLKLVVEDWNRSGSHSLIGETEISVQGLLDLKSGAELSLVKSKKNKDKKKKECGKLVVSSCRMETVPSFLDYIQGGMELSFTVAIDFTASNGDPTSASSLHYTDPTGRPNQYLTAIRTVGEIIQDYDTDKLFPALGFGARLPPNGAVNHQFFLNFSASNPYCEGVDGIVAAYHQAIRSVELYGPTNFSPVINHVASIAETFKHSPTNYQVLLIITDGVITDMEATKAAIISASRLPMSIIIIGVGDADFQAMDVLDSDSELLQHGSDIALRDIVQFVELSTFVKEGETGGWDKMRLAKEVLAELPGQIVSYMKSGGYKPGSRWRE